MWTAVSGRAAVFKQMQVIANNLANVNTSGFKAERLLFEKVSKDPGVLNESLKKEIDAPRKVNTDEYVQISGSYTDFSQGGVQNTGNPFDIAIMGDALFALQTPDGTRYTRAGEFTRNNQGLLATHEGNLVLGQGGPINVSQGQMSVMEDGSVLINGEPVDVLQLVQIDSKDLVREEFQKFALKPGGIVNAPENISVKSGAVEASNVNAVKEITDMIYSTRLFEALQKTDDSSARMTRMRNEIFGGRS